MDIKGYKLLKKEFLKDINSDGYVYEHIGTGARVIIIHNEDTNKVFNITFRTPVYNNTGVPHILEHSVLCGSKKYPVKDPFVELAKGSLNTFLNAMTYPDKTTYPIASYNDNDFKSLCDVYMDAVLNPNIYKYEEIFRQEGWSYQLENEDSDLSINGVVYNEMKGAYSDPESIVSNEIEKNMYPDTTYGYESGGHPEYIPDLSYEEFIDFHKKYYHPTNSYIYFYGNVDINERLTWLDEEYLSAYDKQPVDSEIRWQKDIEGPIEKWIEYPIGEDEEDDNKAIFASSYKLSSITNMEEYWGVELISYMLTNSQGAVLKKRLLEAGVAKSVTSDGGMYVRQPSFSIKAFDADMDKAEEFDRILQETFEEIVEKGFDKETLLAAIEMIEFNIREGDYGRTPKGLMYSLQLLDTLLYDDNMPFDVFYYEEAFKKLRQGVEDGFFEGLIEKYFINNKNIVKVYAKGKKGLAGQFEEQLKDKLKEKKATLSKEEIDTIVRKTRELKEYQAAEEAEEDLKKIPLLSLEDIEKEPEKPLYEERSIDGTAVVYNNITTNKILYLEVKAYLNCLDIDELPYGAFLAYSLGKLNTTSHTYDELEQIINKNTGGVWATKSIYRLNDKDESKETIDIKGKALYSKAEAAAKIINEIMMETKFDDYDRLKELLGQQKTSFETSIINSANFAIGRAGSYISKIDYICEQMAGIDYFRFLNEMYKDFDEKKDQFTGKLSEVYKKIFKKENILVCITADEEGYELTRDSFKKLMAAVPEGKAQDANRTIRLEKKNEGFKTASQVQYVVKAGSYLDEGKSFSGAMMVLSNLMNMDYLWKRVRVDGGAYGCGMVAYPSGTITVYSYRDPHIKNTLNIYDEIPQFLKEFQASERDMTKLIIGTISSMDRPLTASAKGDKNITNYIKGIDYDYLKQVRSQVLGCTVEDIRGLGEIMEKICRDNNICTIGNEAKIVENSQVFDQVVTIY